MKDNNLDKFLEKLDEEKEDHPVSNKVFKEFLNNHFRHLLFQTDQNTKLSWLILAGIIGTAIAVLIK